MPVDNSPAPKAERKVLSRQILVKLVTPTQLRAWLRQMLEIIVCKGGIKEYQGNDSKVIAIYEGIIIVRENH